MRARMTTTKRKTNQASVSAQPKARRGREPEPGGPLSEGERTARYRARKREREGRVPFSALIATETMRQITEMCEAEGKRQGEVVEKAVALAYGRFTRRSAKA